MVSGGRDHRSPVEDMGAKIDCWDVDIDLIARRMVARTVSNERGKMSASGGGLVWRL